MPPATTCGGSGRSATWISTDSCYYQLLTNTNVAGAPAWAPGEETPPAVGGHGHPTGRVRWQVAALDDFKDAGPSSAVFEYWVRTE